MCCLSGVIDFVFGDEVPELVDSVCKGTFVCKFALANNPEFAQVEFNGVPVIHVNFGVVRVVRSGDGRFVAVGVVANGFRVSSLIFFFFSGFLSGFHLDFPALFDLQLATTCAVQLDAVENVWFSRWNLVVRYGFWPRGGVLNDSLFLCF